MDTRAQLIADMNNLILTGGRRTTASNVRSLGQDFIDSMVNRLDDADVNDGYLKINSSGIVNIGFIKKASPTGQFLKDDGTWATVLTSASTWAAVLVAGNQSGGTSAIINNGDRIYLGNSSQGYLRYNNTSSRTELGNAISGDIIRLDDVGGYRVVLSSGQFLALETGQFLVQGNTSGTAYFVSATTSNQVYHPTINIFNAPTHDFNGDVVLSSETASRLPWLNGSKAIKSSNITADGNNLFFAANYGIDTTASGGTDVLNIGATNAEVINYGNAATIHNFLGTAIYELQVNSYVTDKLITLNYGGSIASGIGVGFEIQENSIITGYWKTNSSRDGWVTLLPAISYTGTFDFASLSANRTWTMPDADGTFVLSSTLPTVGFIQGGNAFGATAVLGTTDNYDLNIKTNNTVIARFTAAGAFETNGGNGTNSDVAIHQSASNVAGTGRVIDIYNNSYSKLLFRLTDNGSAGQAYIGNGAIQIDMYAGTNNIYGNSTAVRGQVAGGDHLAIPAPGGNGGTYFSDSSGNPRLYIQNSSSVTVAEILASGVSYLSGGGFDIRATGGNGYLGISAQSSNTSAPSAAGFRLFAGATGSFNWVRNNGVSDTYVRTFDATLTANRTYTLQDVSSTLAMYSNNLSVFASTTSAQLAGVLSDEVGTGFVVFNDSPSFTTKITSPAIYGSTSASGTLLIDSTSNATKGAITFGTAGANNQYYWNVGTSTSLITFRERIGSTTQAAMYMGVASGSETSSNYVLGWDGSLRINGQATTTQIALRAGDTALFVLSPASSISNSFYDFQSRSRTGLTAGTNIPIFNVTGANATWATGSIAAQYFTYYRAHQIIASGSSTVTYLTSFAIEGTTIGSNISATAASTLYLPSKAYTSTTTAIGLDIEIPTGATTNWGIRTTGGIFVNGTVSTVLANAALATSATDGFIYIPTCAGAPTGVPTTRTGTVAMIYDTTNNNFYIYNGAWKKVALT